MSVLPIHRSHSSAVSSTNQEAHRTMRKALLSIVILGALLLGALPAQAASRYEWNDPEGDATGLGGDSTGWWAYVDGVTPNDPQFDITKVTLSSDKGMFTETVSIKKVAPRTPDNSNGYYFRLHFTYAGNTYRFFVTEKSTGARFFGLYRVDNAAALPCRGCTGVIDRTKNQVIVTAPIASLAAAMRAADATKEPMKAGSKLTGLYVLAQRWVTDYTLTSDEAIAPEGVAFKL